MPIGTDSVDWRSGETADAARTKLLGFLRYNPDRAYSVYDLGRELFDADFETRTDGIGDDVGEFGEYVGERINDEANKVYLDALLDDLVASGEVEKRWVSGDEGNLAYYTIAD